MSQNAERLARAIEMFNAMSDDYFDLYDEAIELHGYPPGVEGKEGARAFYGQIWEAFPDYELVIEDQVETNSTIACRFSGRGTHRGAFMGNAPTGRTVVFEGQTFLRFGPGGTVVERWQALDMLPVLVQIGALPAQS